MKANNVTFREVYHKICFISATKKHQKVMQQLPDYEKGNGVLVYGYVDHQAGLTYEILACTELTDEGIISYNGDSTISIKYRSDSVKDCDLFIIKGCEELEFRYIDKIAAINSGYKYSDGVETTRRLSILDDCRNREFPDDVLVVLLHGDNRPEGCWVRCEGIENNQIKGLLLNEPNADFGVHAGNKILFDVIEQGNKYMCIAEV